MQEQGNADGYVIPAADPAEKLRPQYVAVATAAINAVRTGDTDAVQAAREAGPESPYVVGEVAVALRVSKSTIYKAVESGDLVGMRFGHTRKGTIRIPHEGLVDYVAASVTAAVTRPSTRHRSLRVEIRDLSPTGAKTGAVRKEAVKTAAARAGAA